MQNISRSSSSSTSSPSNAIFAQVGHRPSNHCIKTATRPQAWLKTATGQRNDGHRPSSLPEVPNRHHPFSVIVIIDRHRYLRQHHRRQHRHRHCYRRCHRRQAALWLPSSLSLLSSSGFKAWDTSSPPPLGRALPPDFVWVPGILLSSDLSFMIFFFLPPRT